MNFLFNIEFIEKSAGKDNQEENEGHCKSIAEFKLIESFAVEVIDNNHCAL